MIRQIASQLAQFAEPGPVIVTGLIRSSDPSPDDTTTPTNTMYEWYRVDITTLQSQIPYDLMPVYLAAISRIAAAISIRLSVHNHSSN